MGKEGAVGIILEYGAGAHADDGWLRCAEAMRHSWEGLGRWLFSIVLGMKRFFFLNFHRNV